MSKNWDVRVAADAALADSLKCFPQKTTTASSAEGRLGHQPSPEEGDIQEALKLITDLPLAQLSQTFDHLVASSGAVSSLLLLPVGIMNY